MAIDLSGHTMVIHNKISASEAYHLCSLYGVKPLKSKQVVISGTDVNIAGINEISMVGTKIPASGNWIYDVKIQVNLGRLIKETKVAMLLLNKRNVSAIIKRLNEIFARTFSLNKKHSNSDEWHMARLDCGIDLKLGTDDEAVLKAFIKALHTSFDSSNSRGVQYSPYDGYDAPEVQYESVTLRTAGYENGNKLYKYNIYYKLLQLTNYARKHGLTLSQEEIDEIKDVIRIEKQVDDVSKVFGCSNKLGSLLNEDVTEKVKAGIIKEMKLFFGIGDYLTYEEGDARIKASKYDTDTQNSLSILYRYVDLYGYSSLLNEVTRMVKNAGGTDADVSDKHKEIALRRKQLEALGISVSSSKMAVTMKGLSALLDDELKAKAKPRKKHKFSEIRRVKEPSGGYRWLCKPTIYSKTGEFKRTTVGSSIGGSREDCEVEVGKKIYANLRNRFASLSGNLEAQIQCCKDAAGDYERFKTIVKSKDVQERIDKMQLNISKNISKLEDALYGKQQLQHQK